MTARISVFILSLFLLAGCAWVKLTPGGEKVRVLSLSEVSTCKRLGQTTASVTDKVVGLKRQPHIVAENLEMLARNAAADMQGDTIVPQGAVVDGKRAFDVYRCVGG